MTLDRDTGRIFQRGPGTHLDRKKGRVNMGFVDGHAGSLTPSDLASEFPYYVKAGRNNIYIDGVAGTFK